MEKFPTLRDAPIHKSLTSSQLEALRSLESLISDLVSSEEFECLVRLNGWGSQWGHCRVASEALQILAWTTLNIYLVTENYADAPFSHWFTVEPLSREIFDPTAFQFVGAMPSGLYDDAVPRGIQSRISDHPYTRSPATQALIDIVNSANA